MIIRLIYNTKRLIYNTKEIEYYLDDSNIRSIEMFLDNKLRADRKMRREVKCNHD